MNEKMELIKNNLIEVINNKKSRIDKLFEKIEQAKLENIEYKIDRYKTSINDILFTIKTIQGRIDNMREPDIEDLENRKNIYLNYAEEIDKKIPDDVPLVFHGNNNIGLVEEIIKTGGLFTPDERGVSYASLASQIDVTWKGNIQTSLEFAEPGLDSFYPYGAIFVFLPKEEEYDYVLKTGKSSEVFNGVNSIDFKKENRLVSIITTKENLNRLKKLVKENGLDENIVKTHEEFLEYCKEKYNSQTQSR